LVYDSPAVHPRISKEEKDYILKSLNLEKDNIENVELKCEIFLEITC